MKSSGGTGSAGGGSKRGKKGGQIESALKVSAAELEDLKTENAKLSGEIEKLRPKLTAEVRSVEVLTDTNRQLLSKHAEEMQTLRHELDKRTREYSDLQQQFQLQSTAVVIYLEELQQLRAQKSRYDQLTEQVQLLQEKNNELQQSLEEMGPQKGEIAEDVAAEELVGLREELSRKQTEIETLEQTVEQFKQTIADSERRYNLQIEEVRQELSKSAVEDSSASTSSEELSLLKRQLDDKTKQYSDLERLTSTYSTEVGLLKQKNYDLDFNAGLARTKICDLERRLSYKSSKLAFPDGLMASIEQRYNKANDAISHLESELSADAQYEPTPNDTAIIAIRDCLKDGLKAKDPQAYFDDKKDELKTHLNALRGIKSVLNTALNAILTVLAVCSVVGIPALYYTGIWQKNAEKNGSFFAFSMFGAEQKAKCDIYEATQALGVTLGA